MRSSTSTLRSWIIVCHSLTLVCAEYTVTVELKQYQNPSHMRAQSRDCCDGNCSDPCDNRFRFCYSDSPNVAAMTGVLETRPEEAVIGCQLATELVARDNDNLTFSSSGVIGGSVRNPLKFRGDVWPGQAYLLVIVMDVDRDTLDDAVDAILITILPSSLKRYSQTERFTGLFGYGSFTLRYRVDCQDDFHGEDCSVFCSQTDNADGHYWCDRHGNRKCLEGYQNTSTNCTQCVPSIGCSPVGGYCSVPGDCNCVSGYTGPNCTEVAVSEPQQCSTPTEDSTTQSSSVPSAVYALGALVALLAVAVISVSIILVILTLHTRRRRGRRVGSDNQSSRSYYMNEGMGPTQSSTDFVGAHEIDAESERSSRQYATVDSNQRLADMLATAHNAIERSDSDSTAVSMTPAHNDVPSSSLRPNVAYGIEQKRERNGRGFVNGRKAPMRPPPRPPR